MFPFSVLARRARFVISEYGEKILIKSPNCGCPILTNAICSYLARNRGIHVNPQQIIIGSGAEYLYGLVAKLLGKDKIFGTEFPSYTQIQSVYEANGITCEPLTLGKHGILSEELSKTRASVLHITPYRSYPSGVTATASKRREYLQWVSQKDRYIIEDDYESEFSVSSKVEDTLFAMDSLERVIYINTFSKTISPAIRIGYMVLPKPLALQFQSQLSFLSCTVSTFEQYMVASLINSGDFERHINKVRRKKRKSLESK